MQHIIAYDFGTTGVKTCLFEIDKEIKMLASAYKLCKMYGVDMEKLPRIVACTDVVGGITEKAAAELGLAAGTPVYGGGGDATLIGIGAGCTEVGDTHIYSGTSGWVETVTDKQVVDINCMIGAIVGAEKGKYNYFAEMETAGKCFEWVKDHLVLDEVNVYLQKQDVAESKETVYESLYDYMSEVVDKVPAGANGVLFTPWLHGNRCPFEDPNAAGMFFNLRVETVENTKDVGAIGAALLAAVGSGAVKSLDVAKYLVRKDFHYFPNKVNKEIYDKNYAVFKKLYKANKENFALLNKLNGG